MDWVVDRFGKFLKPFEYVIVASGYLLMAGMIWLMVRLIQIYSNPEFIRAIKIPPVLPLFPYLPKVFNITFLPPFYFTYWIVILAIIAVSHEFAHGIFARLNGIKVKSTGFGFLGPFLAAFVEPDEKQIQKAKKFPQLAILAAGTFANVVMTVLFGLILWLFFVTSFTAAGVNFNTYGTQAIALGTITSIGGNPISDISEIPNFVNDSLMRIESGGMVYFIPGERLKTAVENGIGGVVVFEDSPAVNAQLKGPILEVDGARVSNFDELGRAIRAHSPGDTISLTVLDENEKKQVKELMLGERNGEAYLGIGINRPKQEGVGGYLYGLVEHVKDPLIYYEPNYDGNFAWFIYNLLWWIVLINFSVALVNMVPVGIFDGGRFFMLTVWGLTGNKKFAERAFKATTWAAILVVIWLMLKWVLAFI